MLANFYKLNMNCTTLLYGRSLIMNIWSFTLTLSPYVLVLI